MNIWMLLLTLISLILMGIKLYGVSKKYNSLIDRILSFFRKYGVDPEDFMRYLLDYKYMEKTVKDIKKKSGK